MDSFFPQRAQFSRIQHGLGLIDAFGCRKGRAFLAKDSAAGAKECYVVMYILPEYFMVKSLPQMSSVMELTGKIVIGLSLLSFRGEGIGRRYPRSP